jgi:hypothetical protein
MAVTVTVTTTTNTSIRETRNVRYNGPVGAVGGRGGAVTEAIPFTLMLMENWPRGLVFKMRATFMRTQPDITPEY